MINKQIDKKLLEKYFYYGILNKSDLEEGLLFYISYEVHRKGKRYKTIRTEIDEKRYASMSEEQKKEYLREYRKQEDFNNKVLSIMYLRDLVESAMPIFIQYYKFIILPDDKKNYQAEISEKKKDFIKENIIMKLEDMQRQGKINAYPVGVFFNADQEKIYIERYWTEDIYSYKYGHYKHWTQEVFEILKTLNEIEEQDRIRYNEEWINVRLQRAKNRGNDQDDVEIANMEKLKEIFECKKQQHEYLVDEEER